MENNRYFFKGRARYATKLKRIPRMRTRVYMLTGGNMRQALKNHSRCFLFFTLWPVIFCLIACQSETSPTSDVRVKQGLVGYGYLADPKKQQEFLNLLKQESIYFELRELKGKQRVYHKAEDTANFYGLRRKVLYGQELDPDIEESILTIGEKQRDLHIASFKRSDVPFIIKDVVGVHSAWSIKYSQYYGPVVDQIRQEIELKKLKIGKHKMGSEKAIKVVSTH